MGSFDLTERQHVTFVVSALDGGRWTCRDPPRHERPAGVDPASAVALLQHDRTGWWRRTTTAARGVIEIEPAATAMRLVEWERALDEIDLTM